MLHGSHPDAKRPFSVLNASVFVLITNANLRDGTADTSEKQCEVGDGQIKNVLIGAKIMHIWMEHNCGPNRCQERG